MELMSPMWYKKAFWGCAWVWQDGCMCTKGSTQNIYISSDEKLQFQQSTSDPSTAPSILGMWFLFWLGYSSWDRKSLAEWLFAMQGKGHQEHLVDITHVWCWLWVAFIAGVRIKSHQNTRVYIYPVEIILENVMRRKRDLYLIYIGRIS